MCSPAVPYTLKKTFNRNHRDAGSPALQSREPTLFSDEIFIEPLLVEECLCLLLATV